MARTSKKSRLLSNRAGCPVAADSEADVGIEALGTQRTFENALGWNSQRDDEALINHKAEGGERLVVRSSLRAIASSDLRSCKYAAAVQPILLLSDAGHLLDPNSKNNNRRLTVVHGHGLDGSQMWKPRK